MLQRLEVAGARVVIFEQQAVGADDVVELSTRPPPGPYTYMSMSLPSPLAEVVISTVYEPVAGGASVRWKLSYAGSIVVTQTPLGLDVRNGPPAQVVVGVASETVPPAGTGTNQANGLVSGTPATATTGVHTFTICVVDLVGAEACCDVTLPVNPATGGGGGGGVDYSGQWSGTFEYEFRDNLTVPPTVINTSFTLTVTLATKVPSINGTSPIYDVTQATCNGGVQGRMKCDQRGSDL